MQKVCRSKAYLSSCSRRSQEVVWHARRVLRSAALLVQYEPDHVLLVLGPQHLHAEHAARHVKVKVGRPGTFIVINVRERGN